MVGHNRTLLRSELGVTEASNKATKKILRLVLSASFLTSRALLGRLSVRGRYLNQ